MMQRRSFFKSLLGTVAAITVASAVECFGVADKVVEVAKRAKEIIVNPAYFEAAYEDVIFFHPMVVQRINANKAKGIKGRVEDNKAPRYNLEGGKWVEVPFYKEI